MLDKIAAYVELEKGLKHYNIPIYMHQAIRKYVNYHKPPGRFLQAVIKNDLYGAISQADYKNSYALKDWVGFLYNHCPSLCWGSEKVYKEWINKDEDKDRIN